MAISISKLATFIPKADNGQDGADGKSFQWRGIYDSATTYNLNDVVRIDVNSLPVSEYDSAILYDKALFIATGSCNF